MADQLERVIARERSDALMKRYWLELWNAPRRAPEALPVPDTSPRIRNQSTRTK